MPTDLYYTAPNSQDIIFVDEQGKVPFSIGNSSALEAEYRIKVGGEEITPKNDTGMLRHWVKDNDYLKSSFALFSLSADTTGNMNITVKPDFVAPKEVYRASRDMGKYGNVNKVSNLSWEFPVDSGFIYMITLHFCELDPQISYPGDRPFYIYIAGQMADERADVLRWSKQKGVAVYKDHVVIMVQQGNQEKVDLSLELHPCPESVLGDPFLNGLEIFKISDPGSNNLAGPNPVIVPNTNTQTTPKSSSKRAIIIGVVVLGVACGVVLLSLLALFLLTRRSKTNSKKAKGTTAKKSLFSFTKSINTQTTQLPSELCRRFSLAEIMTATNSFDELLLVGVGGFGNVYKGYIDDNATPVAIKRLKPGSQQGIHEFRTEIEMLSQLRHLHLVTLIGYCYESNEMILVYDFMDRGTLRDHLYNINDDNNNNGNSNTLLSWKQRLLICIGAARGLHYLHAGALHNIIHRDVKSTNILLDDKWVAKVSDFGLSKIGPTGNSRTHITTEVKGSLGYLDPEYYKRQRLTLKSDVYSFGVVLFEVLCARPVLMREVEKQQMSLAQWGKCCYDNGTLDQIVDPALKGKIAPECLKKFGEIAVSCLLDDDRQRPSMNDLVWMLEFALKLQDSAEAEQ